MAELKLKNISKSYTSGVRAVADVNLEIADGEFVILVGPSGCGKSTLLRMIAGLEEISAGEVLIGGRVVNDVHAKDRDIAMVFQHYALYPHMTVAENMSFGLKLRHFPKAEIQRRVNEAAELLGLTTYLERKPKALSGGQRQRVAVGRAIVRQPQLFLFDEPLSNLDAKMRVSMRAELIKLHKRLKAEQHPATMVYVTHDQVEAMSMGDRLVVMKDGVVQQIGAPLEIYHHPANQFVASFIGAPPMNLLKADVQRTTEWLAVGAGWCLGLPDTLYAALNQAFPAGQGTVVLGIRPEDLRVSDAALAHFSTRVEIVEQLGGEVLVTCTLGNDEIVARLGARATVQVDEQIGFAVNVAHLKLFDPVTGKTLL